ncbi:MULTISPECIES: hypothetical protein, partial [Bacillus]|uniref:hypothetical protein n=1 Tax=Bacillus TaxID=1386 RepID=UPI002097B69C
AAAVHLSARPKTPVRRKSAKGQPAIIRMKKYDVFLSGGACTIVKEGVFIIGINQKRGRVAGVFKRKLLLLSEAIEIF